MKMILILLIFIMNSEACDMVLYDKDSKKSFKLNSKEHIETNKKNTTLIVWLSAVKEDKEYVYFDVKEVIKGAFPFKKMALSKQNHKGSSLVVGNNVSLPLSGTYNNHKKYDSSRTRGIDCSLPPYKINLGRSYIYFFGDDSEFTFEQVDTKEDNIYKILKNNDE